MTTYYIDPNGTGRKFSTLTEARKNTEKSLNGWKGYVIYQYKTLNMVSGKHDVLYTESHYELHNGKYVLLTKEKWVFAKGFDGKYRRQPETVTVIDNRKKYRKK